MKEFRTGRPDVMLLSGLGLRYGIIHSTWRHQNYPDFHNQFRITKDHK